jgi:GT2 family glycosyltransferase
LSHDNPAKDLFKALFAGVSVFLSVNLNGKNARSLCTSMNNSHHLKFSIDEPVDAQEFASGEVWIRGWAIPVKGDIFVTAKLGDMPWVNIPHGKLRTDVAIAYSDEPNALHSGFSGRIPASHLQPGEYDLTLNIRTAIDDNAEVWRKIKLCDASRLSREAFVASSDDFLRIKLEEPSENTLVLRNSILRVTGWAMAGTEIQQVEIWLDGDGPYIPHYGLMREDIGSLYGDSESASHAGFLWAGQTDRLGPGPHSLTIVATSKAGQSAQLTAPFEIDSRSEYEYWASLNKLDGNHLIDLLEESSGLAYAPKISIVTPVYKTPKPFLIKCVGSVQKQAYPNWELILVDDCSGDPRLTDLLMKFAAEDGRIKVKTLALNAGIAGATNAGIDFCSGEYVALLDHDDELSPDALFSVVQSLTQDPSIDVFYSDEDKLDENGTRRDAFFKPGWSPDLLLSMNYVCHFLVCRRSLLQEVGRLRLGFDGSQDYDLILRLSEHTSKIHRIPKVLYHWRCHENSTAAGANQKPAASGAGRRALEEHLTRRGIEAQVEEIDICRYRVKYGILGEPEVAIIIPTGGSSTLEVALKSVLNASTYKNYRIVVVDNSRQGVASTVAQFTGGRYPIDLLDCRTLPFNFSLLCNKAARETTSEYLLFLNDDTSIITPDWIESMLEHAQRESVGAVGSLLLFPNRTIQHAGVVTGLLDVAGHCFRGIPDSPFYFAFPHVIRNCSAVTGACLMIRRIVFESAGGFDELNLPTCFQDVDLCLRIVDEGYHIVYTPFAKLFHYESVSKKAVADLPELKYMKQRWANYISDDPYYNPNLTRRAEDFSLRYDQLFLSSKEGDATRQERKDSRQLSPALFGLRTAAAKRLGRFGQINFYASQEPGQTDSRGHIQATIFWDVTGPEKVQVRVGSPMGTVFAEGTSSGSATTGLWAYPGLVFYLLDATESSAGSPDKILSVLQL